MNIRGMRIALVTGAYNHIADGVSLTLNRLVGFLEEHGAVPRIYAPTAPAPAFDHAGTLVSVPSVSAPGRAEYRVSLGLGSRARHNIAEFRPHLFHIATPDIAGLDALRIARRTRVPVVATYHTHFASYLDYYRLGTLEGAVWRYLAWFYRQCREVYVPSDSMIAVLRQHGFESNIKLWPRGVDSNLFHPRKRSTAWRRERGIADYDVVIAFVSRLVTEKGLDIVSEVLQSLEARGVNHRMLFVGDGPMKPALERRHPNAIFEGRLRDEALATAYASSDVFLFPSETETFGNVTLEAMCSGLAVVVADAAGSSSLVRDGSTGLLAIPRNADAFRGKVELLLGDADLRLALGQRARSAAVEYDWDDVLGQMIENYEQWAGR